MLVERKSCEEKGNRPSRERGQIVYKPLHTYTLSNIPEGSVLKCIRHIYLRLYSFTGSTYNIYLPLAPRHTSLQHTEATVDNWEPILHFDDQYICYVGRSTSDIILAHQVFRSGSIW